MFVNANGDVLSLDSVILIFLPRVNPENQLL